MLKGWALSLCTIFVGCYSGHAASAQSGHGFKPDTNFDNLGIRDESQTCLLPDTSTGFAVDTDGGAANGSKSHQHDISYQNDYGFKPDPEKFVGAVSIDPNDGLGAFDIVCYENTANLKTVCGFVFDNGYTSEQRASGTKPDKPAEATAFIHKQLGATQATGAGSSLGSTSIKTHPIKLPDHLKEEVKVAMANAKETGVYDMVNQLAQELGGSSPCAGSLNPKLERPAQSTWY